MTGVPQAIASTTDGPKGSAKAMGCSKGRAKHLRPLLRPDRSQVDDPVAVDMRLDLLMEVPIVLHDCADQQPAPDPARDLDGVSGPPARVYAVEHHQAIASLGRERQRCVVDPVVHRGDVVQPRFALSMRLLGSLASRVVAGDSVMAAVTPSELGFWVRSAGCEPATCYP